MTKNIPRYHLVFEVFENLRPTYLVVNVCVFLSGEGMFNILSMKLGLKVSHFNLEVALKLI